MVTRSLGLSGVGKVVVYAESGFGIVDVDGYGVADIEVFFTLLPPIYTGRIGDGRVGIIDGRENGHVPTGTESLNGHLNGGGLGRVSDTVGWGGRRGR